MTSSSRGGGYSSGGRRGRGHSSRRGGRGRAGDKCAMCEETCHGDSDRYLSNELDR